MRPDPIGSLLETRRKTSSEQLAASPPLGGRSDRVGDSPAVIARSAVPGSVPAPVAMLSDFGKRGRRAPSARPLELVRELAAGRPSG